MDPPSDLVSLAYHGSRDGVVQGGSNFLLARAGTIDQALEALDIRHPAGC